MGSNKVSSQNPVMCIPALSNNFGSYGVLEELENTSRRISVISLSKFENMFICVHWLKLLPRLKMGLSGVIGEAKFCRLLFLDICLAPGTEGTGKASTCLFEVAMWVTCCLFYLGECSFHKIDLQLSLHHTNPTCLVLRFESLKYFGEA